MNRWRIQNFFKRHSVHDVQLRNTADQKILFGMQDQFELDLWEHGMPGQREARVMVSEENRAAFLDALDAEGIEHYVHLTNVPEWVSTFEYRKLMRCYCRRVYALVVLGTSRASEKYFCFCMIRAKIEYFCNLYKIPLFGTVGILLFTKSLYLKKSWKKICFQKSFLEWIQVIS